MVRGRSVQGGFTLLEMLIVVAMIAVLAAIALPAYWGTARKAQAAAEVNPYFSDLQSRMLQFMHENGVYPASLSEAGLCPAVPSPTKQDITTCTNFAAWTALRVRISHNTMVSCGFTWVTGLAGDATNIGAVAAAAPFNFTAPAINWYYLLARCNLDGSTTVDTYAFMSSTDPTIRWRDPGH